MKQIREFNWAQDKIDALLTANENTDERRHFLVQHGLNRAQRREQERAERRAAKKTRMVRA